MDKKPQILHRSLVAESRLFRIESLDLRFSNGVERTYERLVPGGGGAVMVVALLDDDTVALIREYGGGIEDYTLTLPKGAVDMGESLRDASNRELQEETPAPLAAGRPRLRAHQRAARPRLGRFPVELLLVVQTREPHPAGVGHVFEVRPVQLHLAGGE